jgi:hypothetical protein
MFTRFGFDGAAYFCGSRFRFMMVTRDLGFIVSSTIVWMEKRPHGGAMLTVGLILMLIGFLLGIPILWTIGVVLAVVGAVLWILGAAGREVGGRRHYY